MDTLATTAGLVKISRMFGVVQVLSCRCLQEFRCSAPGLNSVILRVQVFRCEMC